MVSGKDKRPTLKPKPKKPVGRRTFKGIRDKYGRATKLGKKLTTPKKNKRREYPAPPPGYPFGRKPWLKRKEVWWEFGLCPRSISRLEQRGQLHARVLMGEYFYDRNEVDAAIRESVLAPPPPEKSKKKTNSE